MYIEEVFRKLRPVYGRRIDDLWRLYLSEGKEGQQRIERIVNVMALKVDDYRRESILLPPPSKEKADGEYYLGDVIYGGTKIRHRFGLREDEWIKHMIVVGSSGAGKTNFVCLVLRSFLEKDKNFLVFDWKRSYRHLLTYEVARKIKVYTAGRGVSPISFNIWIPPEGVDIKVWIRLVVDVLCHAYFAGEGVKDVMVNSVDRACKECGIYRGNKEYFDNHDLLRYVEEVKKGARISEWKMSAMRIMRSLTFGAMAGVVNGRENVSLEMLFDGMVIIELDSLADSDKIFVSEFLMLYRHQSLLHKQQKRERFLHCLVIDESHEILNRKKSEMLGSEAITDVIFREVREFGQSIIAVAQNPCLLSVSAIGNSYSTISFNLKTKQDISAIGSAMLLNSEEQEYLGKLELGHSIVKLQGRHLNPFLIKVPLMDINKGAVSDVDIKAHMAVFLDRTTRNDSYSAGNNRPQAVLSEAMGEKKPGSMTEKLLKIILETPFSGTASLYMGCGLTSYSGNKAKNKLIEDKLAEQVTIATKRARLSLIRITDIGLYYMRKKGYRVSGYPPNLEHDFWKNAVAENFRKDGYLVRVEEPVNGNADIVIEKNGKRAAVEIETGKSDFASNIQKNLSHGFSFMFSVATNESVYEKIRLLIKKKKLGGKAFVIRAKEFS